MIKANELRLGNLVYYQGNQQQIYFNGRTFGFFEKGFRWTPETIDPIPLSPELLQQCGFKEMEDNGKGIGVFVNGIYDIERVTLDSKEWSFAVNEKYTNTKLKYLHQLQNLFFALTGEELKINQVVK